MPGCFQDLAWFDRLIGRSLRIAGLARYSDVDPRIATILSPPNRIFTGDGESKVAGFEWCVASSVNISDSGAKTIDSMSITALLSACRSTRMACFRDKDEEERVTRGGTGAEMEE